MFNSLRQLFDHNFSFSINYLNIPEIQEIQNSCQLWIPPNWKGCLWSLIWKNIQKLNWNLKDSCYHKTHKGLRNWQNWSYLFHFPVLQVLKNIGKIHKTLYLTTVDTGEFAKNVCVFMYVCVHARTHITVSSSSSKNGRVKNSKSEVSGGGVEPKLTLHKHYLSSLNQPTT